MIFTRSILNEVLFLENSGEELCRILNNIGLEVESFKRVSAPSKVVVGKILECQKHPDATKLNICQVAISTNGDDYEIRQIVCGAKNAREGIYVAVALEGAVLPSITIKKAKLRGVDSCGMLCSTSELGFPGLYDGIVELDSSIGELVIGKELSEYPIFCDEVYEISITPNRGDCMNLLGIARDLSAAFGVEMKKIQKINIPDSSPGIGRVLQVVSDEKIDSSVLYRAFEAELRPTNLKNSLFLAYNESLCSNYLKNALNFTTLYSGVIMNAYPQKFCHLGDVNQEKITLHVKKDEKGFDSVYFNDLKLSTIGVNNYISCNNDSLGNEFIIVEASYIPPYIVASNVCDNKPKDLDAHIFQRTSRGSNPNLLLGLDILCDMIICDCSDQNCVIYKDTQEIITYTENESIAIDINLVGKIIGKEVEKTEIINILKALEFEVEISSDDTFLLVKAPLFRHDINNLADISEEIIRFIGIDNVISKPCLIVQNNQSTDWSHIYKFRRNLAKAAIYSGFNETIHFVFFNKEKLESYGFETLKEELDLTNPITNDLNTLRSTLLCGLLDSVLLNKNNGFTGISLFELGSAYTKDREEKILLSFVQSGFVNKEHFPITKGYKGDFFTFANRISNVIGEFELVECSSSISLFHPGQCAKVIQDGKEVGVISTLHPKVANALGLDTTYLCEIEISKLESKIPSVKKYSKFQKTTRDLSVVINKEVPYFKIRDSILSLNIQEILKFYPLDIYNDEKLGENNSLTIRFELQSMDKTLEDKDIVSITDRILEALKNTFNIELR
ncbi:phenylalanine--tRNA ligase subunit beta [Helicobacter ibis]|uniref:Phenylalanine--tRNA ligase beta subunit n=1 Tax=Helicobacter ibis TaxID=2962633 RepID=A0ABT4VDJ3_9HELI|nr:phenylalanine--tRNA ligase subunit beta [Helicobacter ibis]MDA3968238.1 phenylalanine--tRNA ligase subunit beta [Helicobacter ibis]